MNKEEIVTEDKIEKILKANNHENLIDVIKNINSQEAPLMAKGIELVIENFDCYPNGGVLHDIVSYLKNKKFIPTFSGTLFFKDDQWFFKFADLIHCNMTDEDYLLVPIETSGLDTYEWQNNQLVECFVKNESFDLESFAPIHKAYFKKFIKQ